MENTTITAIRISPTTPPIVPPIMAPTLEDPPLAGAGGGGGGGAGGAGGAAVAGGGGAGGVTIMVWTVTVGGAVTTSEATLGNLAERELELMLAAAVSARFLLLSTVMVVFTLTWLPLVSNRLKTTGTEVV